MTSGSPMKLILGFSIPLLFGNLFQQFYSMVDTMIVGRVLGTGPLAAVGSTGSITFLIIGIIALKAHRYDFGTICGILCGSMANPMALGYANDTLKGDTASISYASVYPLGMFIRVVIAQMIIMFFV